MLLPALLACACVLLAPRRPSAASRHLWGEEGAAGGRSLRIGCGSALVQTSTRQNQTCNRSTSGPLNALLQKRSHGPHQRHDPAQRTRPRAGRQARHHAGWAALGHACATSSSAAGSRMRHMVQPSRLLLVLHLVPARAVDLDARELSLPCLAVRVKVVRMVIGAHGRPLPATCPEHGFPCLRSCAAHPVSSPASAAGSMETGGGVPQHASRRGEAPAPHQKAASSNRSSSPRHWPAGLARDTMKPASAPPSSATASVAPSAASCQSACAMAQRAGASQMGRF